MQKGRKKTERAREAEPADLAVYAHRVLAALRPLNALDSDAVLHAALELNRPSHIHLPPLVSPSESPKLPEES